MENNKETRTWLDDHKLDHPMVIAGPCSAETEEQVHTIANDLKDSDVSYFRAGVWKPRTRPGGFEGIGEPALKWLADVRKQTGMKVATEVANAAHIELALKHDVDLLWIGARSTVSPFIIQEIADALQGTDKIVLLKNPVNPDLALWMGATERLYKANIKKLGVIHRGFSTFKKTKYRNIPEWQLAIEFKNKLPDVPMFCDPSHITGNRGMIQDVSQMALDLNYDGLMIETHIDPDNAWSDAAQQVTPNVLIQMMEDLKVRKVAGDTSDYKNKLAELRSQIDICDQEVLDVMIKRMDIVQEIGNLKKLNNVAVLQNTRWTEIMEKMQSISKDSGLSVEFVQKIYTAIHQESINRQEKTLKG